MRGFHQQALRSQRGKPVVPSGRTNGLRIARFSMQLCSACLTLADHEVEGLSKLVVESAEQFGVRYRAVRSRDTRQNGVARTAEQHFHFLPHVVLQVGENN